MKRTHMHEMKQVSASGKEGDLPAADLRVRVDMNLLGLALAGRAMTIKGRRVLLFGGAISVEAFNVVAKPADQSAGGNPDGP